MSGADYWAGLPPEQDRPADVREVGVGPWPGGEAAWPTDPRYDRELLRDGDRRNVVDRYRYWSVEAVRADLASRAHGLHVAIENVTQDLNIGSIVRTANAFNVGAVHVVSRSRSTTDLARFSLSMRSCRSAACSSLARRARASARSCAPAAPGC